MVPKELMYKTEVIVIFSDMKRTEMVMRRKEDWEKRADF